MDAKDQGKGILTTVVISKLETMSIIYVDGSEMVKGPSCQINYNLQIDECTM